MGQSSLFWNRTRGCLTMLHMTGLGTYPKRELWQQASPVPYRLPRSSSECMNLSARTCLWYYMCLSSLPFPPPLILKPFCPRNLGNPWENSNTHTKTLVDRDRQKYFQPSQAVPQAPDEIAYPCFLEVIMTRKLTQLRNTSMRNGGIFFLRDVA